MTKIIIRQYKKAYKDSDGDVIVAQPLICANCGYDSTLDNVASLNYCPNCGEKIESFEGNFFDD